MQLKTGSQKFLKFVARAFKDPYVNSLWSPSASAMSVTFRRTGNPEFRVKNGGAHERTFDDFKDSSENCSFLTSYEITSLIIASVC